MDENRKEAIVAAIIVVGIILIIIAFANGWFQKTEETEEIFSVYVLNDPVMGAREAPVTIIEFSDFSCSFCALFVNTTKPTLMEYVDAGTVRFSFKDFPLTTIHPKAAQVAKAAGCAEEQELFWEYHDLVYANMDRQEIAHLRSYAEEAGLNITLYDECFSSERRFAEIQLDIQNGRELGITGTPTFFVNGKKYVGALTPEELDAAVAEALVR